jgi:glutamate dehydrogenase
MLDETGAPLPVVARAHVIARDVFGVPELWRAIDDLDLVVPATTQDRMFLAVRRTVERSARWLVRHGSALELAPTVARFRAPVASIVEALPNLVMGRDAEALRAFTDGLRSESVGQALAGRVAAVALAAPAFAIADVALVFGIDVLDAAGVYVAIADRLRLDWLRDRVGALPRADRWQAEARAALRDDVADLNRALTEAVLHETAEPSDPAARVDRWIAAHAEAADRYRSVLADIEASGVLDLATLSAARRDLRGLVDANGSGS